ncbi:hypothetical protein SMACR_01887 [Sordaria macrospora]|uniref:Methyltransferase tdiE n=1 Tax=Sordaria macrospora TaxID=5147 RepID=A0A8S9A109_SORMA|nr:hypothetical protein SMACR_01887 [Sordaria macrospora]KAH7631812.1 hypothetical protein B0T09DRAFT_397304 [Sordaria sp. MPI-SDFR-AT-0083]WPJ63122.1 hypothetical protein SMAC4_01887 [Sordaria macrospora]
MATAPSALPASTPLTAEVAENLGILPASHWHHDEDDAGADTDDTASTIGSITSSTASLSESIFEYRQVLGRTYHRDVGTAEAWQPNDPRHIEAMDLFHHLQTLILSGKLFRAPLSKSIQKSSISEPAPVFGLIGIVEDWERYYQQAFRCCKPGGYVEDLTNGVVLDSDDGTVKEGGALHQWGKVFHEGGRKLGRTFKVIELGLHKKAMEKAGFVDIVIEDYKVPIGPWPEDKKRNELGTWAKIAMESDLEGYVNYIWGFVLGWAPEEISQYCAAVRRELKNPNIHSYYRTRVAYGRKPE